MATKKEIEAKFLEVCESYGLKTDSERGVDSHYKHSFHVLDFNSYYGYEIQKIHKNTGCSNLTPRMTGKEIFAYMGGLLDALNFKANEN